MFRSTTIRALVLAVAAMALSASAAQARPFGEGLSASTSPSAGYHTFYRPTQPQGQVAGYHTFYRPIPSTRTTPVAIPAVKPAPRTASSAGFDWTTALVGAAIVGVVLLLAAIPASRIRPRRVAQF